MPYSVQSSVKSINCISFIDVKTFKVGCIVHINVGFLLIKFSVKGRNCKFKRPCN